MGEPTAEKPAGRLPWAAPHLRTLPVAKTAASFLNPNADSIHPGTS